MQPLSNNSSSSIINQLIQIPNQIVAKFNKLSKDSPLFGIVKRVVIISASIGTVAFVALAIKKRVQQIRQEAKERAAKRKLDFMIPVSSELEILKKDVCAELKSQLINSPGVHSAKIFFDIHYDGKHWFQDHVIKNIEGGKTLEEKVIVQKINDLVQEILQKLPVTHVDTIEIRWNMFIKDSNREFCNLRYLKKIAETNEYPGAYTESGILYERIKQYFAGIVKGMGRDTDPLLVDDRFNFI